MNAVREVPLVQFGLDPTLLTRWMAKLPRRVAPQVYVLADNAEHERRKNIAQCRSWYARNRGYKQAMQRLRYKSDPEAARAKLRARYAARSEVYRERQRERDRARRTAAAILAAALRWLETRS